MLFSNSRYSYLLFLLTAFSTSSLYLGYEWRLKSLNDRPIIGVLSQELSHSLATHYPGYTAYIAASYVKYLHGGGARVVPIWVNQPDEYYENIVNSVNGILFPGGSADLNESGYGKAGHLIYHLAAELNARGDYFPLWGTCLGFELMNTIGAGKSILSSCSAQDIALPLKFSEGYLESKLFKTAPEDILISLANKDVTANFHRFCVTEEDFNASQLKNQFNVLSLGTDTKNQTFISAVEAKTLPFYAVQFHPEKNSFEWNVKERGIPHSAEAIRVGQYFAEFFVNEARKNGHKFESAEEETQHLIFNYNPTFTGAMGITFDECYLF